MSNYNSATSPNSSKVLNSASTLLPEERKRLAIGAIAGVSTISKLAGDADTSRKFIYAQKEKDPVNSALRRGCTCCSGSAC